MTSAHAHVVQNVDRSTSRERRLRFAITLNVIIVAAQIVFGVVAGSLGLLSDAAHNLTDVAALILSLIALRIARRAPTTARSFGWHRGTILAAQTNATLILVVTVGIVVESVRRLMDPPAVQGSIMLIVALVAFVANTIAAFVVHERHSHDGPADLNMRSALLHLTSDALASLGVAVAGAIMLWTDGWNRLDPAVSLLIALSIAWHGVKLLRASTSVLLEGTPEGVDPDQILATIAAIDGTESAHDLHVWAISSDVLALSVHVVVEGHPSLEEAQAVANRVRKVLATEFRITHATIELECESCTDLGPACHI
jgi:cobalt-zinc-cadmium efflux system protein